MSRALFVKELREPWWMGLAGLLIVFGIVLDAMGIGLGHDWRIEWVPRRQSPFLEHDFAMSIGMTALCLGAALGIWQTLSESITGTWTYLLHRPISRTRIIATKLLAGLAVLTVSIGLPLLFYFFWALVGTYPAPFEVWMVEDTLRLSLLGGVAYLAVFLIGIRAARVYISGLWPAVVLWLIVAVQMEFDWLPSFGWCLSLLSLALFLPAIFFAARHRDYA